MGEVGDGRKKRRSRWSLALKKLLDLGRRKSDGRGRGRTRHGGVILEGKRVNGTSHLLLPRDVRGRQPISDTVVNTSCPNASRAIQKPGPPALSCPAGSRTRRWPKKKKDHITIHHHPLDTEHAQGAERCSVWPQPESEQSELPPPHRDATPAASLAAEKPRVVDGLILVWTICNVHHSQETTSVLISGPLGDRQSSLIGLAGLLTPRRCSGSQQVMARRSWAR